MKRTPDVISLAMYANAVADRYAVTVQSGGSTAYTVPPENGKGALINVPAVIPDIPEAGMLVEGYVDHEVGHCRYSDWQEWKALHAEGPMERSIGNAVEDAFVERRLAEDFPGVADRLALLNTTMFGKPVEEMPPSDNPAGAVHNHVLYQCITTARYCSDAVRERAVAMREQCESLFPGLPAALDTVLADVPTVQSTADTARIARDAVAVIRQYLQDQGQQDGQDQPQDGQSQDGQSQDGQSQDGQSQDDQSDGQDCQGQDGQGNAGQSARDALQEALDNPNDQSGDATDKGKRIQEALGGDKGEWQRQIASVAGSYGADMADRLMDRDFDALSAEQQSRAMQQTSALRGAFAALLQHVVRNREGRWRHGRLDRNSLHRLACRDPRVFERRVDKVRIATDVAILADASGSMMGAPAALTSLALHAVVSALRSVQGVRCAAWGFTGKVMHELLSWDAPMSAARLHMRQPNGGTPAGAMLHDVLQRFPNANNERRRIVLVMTDGQVADVELWETDVRMAEKCGITVLGLGIADKAICSVLPAHRCRVIDSLQHLPQAMLDMLRDELVRQAA